MWRDLSISARNPDLEYISSKQWLIGFRLLYCFPKAITRRENKMKNSYNWIAKEIASLDPYRDYERIWQLMTCYYFGDFMMNFLYTNQFPYYIMTPHVATAVSRNGTGKLMKQKDKREADTASHFWSWFEYGPSHPITQESIKRVNAAHAGVAKRVGPGLYTHDYDYTYTLCMLAADYHRLRVRCGLKGYTENEKIAAHLFWQEITKLFRREGEQPATEFDQLITDFPDNWDGMLAYLENHEAKDWPYTEDGAICAEALLQQFEQRWFPTPFRFIGRNLMLALIGEPPHRVHKLPYPNALVTKLMEFTFSIVMFTKEKILPDPKITTPEKHRRALQPIAT
jgi:hypothetical protein